MTWFQQALNGTEAEKAHVKMFIAVYMDFPTAPVRVFTGRGTFTIAGWGDFVGIGDIGRISTPVESSRLVSLARTYQLTGCDPALVSEADIDGSFGRAVAEFFGFVNEAGSLVAEPELTWEGRIDQIKRVDGAFPIIEVKAEHRSVFLQQSDGHRYTHEHQQRYFPGDNGLLGIAGINMKTVIWGGKATQAGTPRTSPPR